MNHPKLTICILSRDLIHAHTSMCLNQVSTNPELLNRYNISQRMFVGGSLLSITRSVALTEWFQDSVNDDLFLFIDADQTFSVNDILKAITLLDETQSDVVCGAYPRHDGQMVVKPYDVSNFESEQHGPIKYGATGFMLISKTILHKLDLMPVHVYGRENNVIPYFNLRVIDEFKDGKSINLWLSEDYSFCWLIRQYGGKIHGFISPTLGHILTEHKYLST